MARYSGRSLVACSHLFTPVHERLIASVRSAKVSSSLTLCSPSRPLADSEGSYAGGMHTTYPIRQVAGDTIVIFWPTQIPKNFHLFRGGTSRKKWNFQKCTFLWKFCGSFVEPFWKLLVPLLRHPFARVMEIAACPDRRRKSARKCGGRNGREVAPQWLPFFTKQSYSSKTRPLYPSTHSATHSDFTRTPPPTPPTSSTLARFAAS